MLIRVLFVYIGVVIFTKVRGDDGIRDSSFNGVVHNAFQPFSFAESRLSTFYQALSPPVSDKISKSSDFKERSRKIRSVFAFTPKVAITANLGKLKPSRDLPVGTPVNTSVNARQGNNGGNTPGVSGLNSGNNQGVGGLNNGNNQGISGLNNGNNIGIGALNNGNNQGISGLNNGNNPNMNTQGVSGLNSGNNQNMNTQGVSGGNSPDNSGLDSGSNTRISGINNGINQGVSGLNSGNNLGINAGNIPVISGQNNGNDPSIDGLNIGNLTLLNARTKPFFSYELEMNRLGVYTGRLDPDDTHEPFKGEYDFIVVGAGSAGAVIASRLSEVPEWSVLLLEAGGPETVLSEARALFATLPFSDKDWKIFTPPQITSCLAYTGSVCVLVAGKLLGGSSALNGMIYSRGSRADFDEWENLGNYGWGYKDVLPYFLRSEDNQNPYLTKTPYHATGGPQTITEGPWMTPLAPAFVKAAESIGYNNTDTNGKSLTGANIYQCTMRGGTRCSSNKAFIRPFRKRNNLQVATYSQATKILIDDKDKRAYGVQFERNGKRYIAHAKKEVIVSAGALNTPKLLLLSGIGPKLELLTRGIPVVVDSPYVGQNFMDHPGTLISFTLTEPVSYVTPRFVKPETIYKYIDEGRGPLTSAGSDANGYFHTKYSNGSADTPDIELVQCACVFVPDEFDSRNNTKGIYFRPDFYDAYINPLLGKDVLTFIVTLTRPQSRGFVKLYTADPSVIPLVDSNYFTARNDMDVLIEGIKIAIKIGESEAYRAYGSKLYANPVPGCEPFVFGTDLYWECFARQYTHTAWHYSGTCKMGPTSDPTAVVDPELQVYGVRGLRVADASIMPVIPRVHLNAACMMIGEKAADLIKRSWKGKAHH